MKPETFVPYMPRGPATRESVTATLQGALALLGPNGEHWIKGELRGPGPSYDMVGAIEQAAPNYESYAAARDMLKAQGITGGLDRWNDRTERTFADVRAALEGALALT